MKELLTANDVMELLGIKRTTFYKYLKVKKLPTPAVNVTGTKKGNRWTKEQIETFIRKQLEFYELQKS